MRRFVSSLIGASLLLGPASLFAKPNQQVNANSSQTNLDQRPSECEKVQITLNSGRKIDVDSYKHQQDHVEITRRGIGQVFADSDIKRVELRQGYCHKYVVTLKTGEKVEGYLRNPTCGGLGDCRLEIKQKMRVRSVAGSEIKGIKYKTPFLEKLTTAALIPLYPLLILILAISCGSGCEL